MDRHGAAALLLSIRTNPGALKASLHALIVLFIGATSSSQSSARDLETLTQVVVPAYIAMNFAGACRHDDPWFLTDTQGPRGTAIHYAEHVKNEVIESLTDDEARSVLRRAADAARTTSREELKSALPNYPHGQAGELLPWCKSTAATFVRNFIEQHDKAHEAILQRINQAKERR